MPEPDDIPGTPDPQKLANMLQAGKPGRLWRDDELGAVLRHQLSAPVNFDLEGMDKGESARLETLAQADQLLIRSFADLLFHPHPPVELLQMTKDFAKACSLHPDSPLPQEIAKLLYFAAIAAAMVKCDLRITALGPVELQASINWLCGRDWVDDRMKDLLRQASNRLTANGVSGHG